MRLWAAGFMVLVACGAPDPNEDGFVVVDPEARAAGVSLRVEGETRDSTLPMAVGAREQAQVHRSSGQDEPLVVAPGEMVEIAGREGRVRRVPMDRDQLVVDGSPEGARLLAELVGAQARPTADGRWVIEGPDVLLAAAVLGQVPGITASRARAADDLSYLPVLLEQTPLQGAGPAIAERDSVSPSAPIPDAASLVGAYVHGDISLILDAAGGYTLTAGSQILRGTFRGCPGGVVFEPQGGGPASIMSLEGENLVDNLGVDYAP